MKRIFVPQHVMFGQQDLQSEGDFDAKAALFRRGLESEKVIPEGFGGGYIPC